MSNHADKVAIVTGASAGIGAVYADRLAKRGYDLILVARRVDRLQSLASQIISDTGRKVEVVEADLTDRDGVARVEDILRNDERVSLLVNNAGVAAVTPLLDTDVNAMSTLVSINIDALMRLTYAVAPGFVKRGSGTIINIASAVSIGTERLNGVYSGSKAFVLAFSQSLKHELSDKGVRVQAVLPGATATDIWANAGLPVTNLPKEMVMQTEAMVDAALAGLDQGEFMTSPSLPDLAEWDEYEKARVALSEKLSLSEPAARYRAASTAV
ncbi:SDR family NAD(P)-dependent oxidoreductase [Paraburkholderia sp. ZP32-5]|uniref:SDR family NAD(P)-dependent oxidoreductase n=1 Tax=Paraburkholderia sp. ZP32-5 TaxID=2883245 RepID=UPI001F26607C|nr:SDR family oxidoreductase [Paraburkholderia sp. ZP32-5]